MYYIIKNFQGGVQFMKGGRNAWDNNVSKKSIFVKVLFPMHILPCKVSPFCIMQGLRREKSFYLVHGNPLQTLPNCLYGFRRYWSESF